LLTVIKGRIMKPFSVRILQETRRNSCVMFIKTASYSIWGRAEVHTGFWWGDLREGDHLEDPGVDGRIILKWILKKWSGGWHGLD
jgi:hypothetical protein